MTPEDRALLETLLESWFLAVENGEDPDPHEHCAQVPHLQSEFARLLGRSMELDDLIAPPPAAPAAKAEAPRQLGDFELLTQIGVGGSGEVFLARQTSLRRLVAVKLLKTTGDVRSQQRLQREAEVAASLDHPSIVPIYAVGNDGEQAWIAMKWLTGPALDGVEVPMEPKECARIVAAAARALHEAHIAGIVHRDVKPSNIVLDGDNPCIVDFGLAREGHEVARSTIQGQVSGTLLYMSPEQLRSGASAVILDARTDVYSLGATLYELLTGGPPFDGDNPGQVIHEILESEPSALPVARDLATIVLRAMDKDREGRFPSALAMAEDLERFLAEEPILSRPVGVTTRVWKLARRNRVATSLLATALFVSVVLAVILAWNVREQQLSMQATYNSVVTKIDAGELTTARTLLAPHLDNNQDAKWQALHAKLLATEQLEQLLDLVQSRPEDVIQSQLEAAIRIDAEALPPHRLVDYQLARPLALALAGQRREAESSIRLLPSSRGRDALLAAIIEQPGDWQLPPARKVTDHLFAALAMRFADRPLADRRAEINAGRLSVETNRRLLLQHSIQLINEERHGLAAEALGGLVSESGNPRLVRRLLLREWMLRDDVTEAARQQTIGHHLPLLRQACAGGKGSPADAGTILDAMFALGGEQAKEAATELQIARKQWPEDWFLAVLEAQQLLQVDAAAARDLLQQSKRYARNAEQVEESELLILALAAAPVSAFWDPWRLQPDAAAMVALQAIIERAERVARDTGDAEVRDAATCFWARGLLALGDLGAAQAALQTLDVGSPIRVLESGAQALAHTQLSLEHASGRCNAWQEERLASADESLGRDSGTNLMQVKAPVERVLNGLPKNHRMLGRPTAAQGWVLLAWASTVIKHKEDALRAIHNARALLDGDDLVLRLLDQLEAALPR